ncbi:MAG TPA: hypothetical protein ENJ57_04030 [Rhizobiales bacterium]|nr:hypothetical protein [Hyphomicrobiales bacterium]
MAAQPRLVRPWEHFVERKNADHPLAGRIWSVRAGKFISPAELADQLAGAHYLLLGETHDNRDHHRLQAWVISQITRRGRKPAVVMEMIDSSQDKALAAYQKTKDHTAAGLGAAIDWKSSGWPDWRMYQPIAEAAFSSGLKIHSANFPRMFIRKAGKKGLGVLSAERRKVLLLDQPLPEIMEADLRKMIVESHCNLLPAAATGPMVNIQRLRDAAFADAMIRAGEKAGAVMILGAEHARTDRGVPWYLARRSKSAPVSSLIMIEARPENQKATESGPKSPDGRLAADYLWFTPMAERPDPCEGLKRHLMKKREKMKKTK